MSDGLIQLIAILLLVLAGYALGRFVSKERDE